MLLVWLALIVVLINIVVVIHTVHLTVVVLYNIWTDR